MRILMRRRTGYRNVRGGHVIELQKAISPQVPMPISIDGIFGNQTESALKFWQKSNGVEPTGMVDEITWTATTQKQIPSLFRRCLAITAAFEGHGYTIARGNWDNAYLTWGVVGFTLKHGNFGKVVRITEQRHPGLIEFTIGNSKSTELLKIIDAKAAEKKSWGNSISLAPQKYRIHADWEDAFEELGNLVEVRSIQDEVAHDVYWAKAQNDNKKYGKNTERDAALFFDTAVQNGGINSKKADLLAKKQNENPSSAHDDELRLRLTAEAIAEGSNPNFYNDVLSRKGSIASGEGWVHGAGYFIADWAITL